MNGRRAITPDTALRRARHLGTTAEFSTDLQVHHELESPTPLTGHISL